MQGVILDNGYVLGDDNKTYLPDRLYGKTILLACSSWSRFSIEDVKGKRVQFVISPTGHAYNFELIK